MPYNPLLPHSPDNLPQGITDAHLAKLDEQFPGGIAEYTPDAIDAVAANLGLNRTDAFRAVRTWAMTFQERNA